MKFARLAATTSLIGMLAGCMTVPVVDYDEMAASNCRTLTHNMSLKTVEVGLNGMQCRDEACLAIVLAVSAGSVIVSGSIVLTNNTVHWLEYQGTCNGGYLNTARRHFMETLSNPQPITTLWQAK